MLELYISQNKNTASEAYGKYYPRVSYKQTMGIHEMAVHMAEHNTPFSEGTIEGILRDFVKCVREQTLNGNTVKVDNLAIFNVTKGTVLFCLTDSADGATGQTGRTVPFVSLLFFGHVFPIAARHVLELLAGIHALTDADGLEIGAPQVL